MTTATANRAPALEAPARYALAPSARLVAAALAWTAALVHLALTPEHFEERTVYGLFFLAAALFQLWLGWRLVGGPSAAVLRAGAFGSLGLIATWILTRTLAPPLGEKGGPEPVTLLGVLATGAELATLFILATLLPAPRWSRRRSRWLWGTTAGLSFAFLFLLASSAISYVPWATKEIPSFNNQYNGFSLGSPFIIGMPLPHIWMVGAWSTFAATAVAAGLVAATVIVSMGGTRTSVSCTARRRGVVAVAPALFAVSSCCGTSVALFLGVSTTVALLRFTPWILLTTVLMLSANLILTVRGRSPAPRERGGSRWMEQTFTSFPGREPLGIQGGSGRGGPPERPKIQPILYFDAPLGIPRRSSSRSSSFGRTASPVPARGSRRRSRIAKSRSRERFWREPGECDPLGQKGFRVGNEGPARGPLVIVTAYRGMRL